MPNRNEMYRMLEPILRQQAEQGFPLPDYISDIDLSDLSDNPIEARRKIERFVKNAGTYKADVPLFGKKDEWEAPPISPELRIVNRRKDNTTPQIIDLIERVAAMPIDQQEADSWRRRAMIDEARWRDQNPLDAEIRDELMGMLGVSRQQPSFGDEFVTRGTQTSKGVVDYGIGIAGETGGAPREPIPEPPPFVFEKGDHASGGRGKDWKSSISDYRPPYGKNEDYVVVRRGDETITMTKGEFEKGKEFYEKYLKK